MTGAAKPLHIDGYDGRANCADALRVLAAEALRPWTLGVVVVLGETVHAARYVHKADSALQGGMFVSHPGPLAQVRSGAVRVYVPALPPLDRVPADQHVRDNKGSRARRQGTKTRKGDQALRTPVARAVTGCPLPDHRLALRPPCPPPALPSAGPALRPSRAPQRSILA